MMDTTKEFCNYNQSLGVKELGFDEPCMATIDQTEYIHINGTKYPIRGAMCYLEVSAPLKQQVFRWARLKHNIQSSIEWNKSDHVWFTFKIYFERLATGENPPVMVGHTVNSWLGLNLEFKTYEEAEDACIDKLIEICKNKKQ